MNYLDLESIRRIHEVAVEFFKEVNEPIATLDEVDIALLDSALHAPRTSFGGREKYQSLEMKAAALFYSLIQNHPFPNGNKRIAVVATDTFLYINGKDFIVETKALYDYSLKIADSSRQRNREQTIRNTARWIKKHSADIKPTR